MEIENSAISHTFENVSILCGAVKFFCDCFDWTKISKIVVLIRYSPPNIDSRQTYYQMVPILNSILLVTFMFALLLTVDSNET